MPAKIHHLPPHLLAERRDIGDRIRALREARGWSQEQLAERTGLARHSVYRAELSSRGQSIDAYLLIADALGVPLWRLHRDDE